MSKRIFESFLLFTFFGLIYVKVIDGSMKDFMELHHIVPDVISEAPELTLNIVYEGGVNVENGFELKPTQVRNQPSVVWNPAPETFYTLMLVSPDTPSRAKPKMKELQNWVVVNIPGNDISKGEVLTEYIGAGPSAETGLHRYIFLLYKQSAKTTFDEEYITKTSSKGRFYFSTRNFIEKHGLGVPIAGNFFQAQYDDYVPELHKQIDVIFDIKK